MSKATHSSSGTVLGTVLGRQTRNLKRIDPLK